MRFNLILLASFALGTFAFAEGNSSTDWMFLARPGTIATESSPANSDDANKLAAPPVMFEQTKSQAIPAQSSRKEPFLDEAIYPKGGTALLFIDPYNDFLAEDGKMWPALSKVAKSVDLHANLSRTRGAVREAGMPIFILPHHRHKPADFEGWTHLTPSQRAAHQYQLFAVDSPGGEWYPGFGPEPGDIVVQEHWGASSLPIPTLMCSCASTGSPMSSSSA
jgi:hypothetical protein